jgi:hypothetical protein
VHGNSFTPGNPSGGYETGVGDILVQALLVAPPCGKTAFAFGTQLIVPTGTEDQFTTGKWQLVPTAAVLVQIPKLSRGSFVGLLVRDTFSFAGDDSRAKINVASLQPLFNWALPSRWFMTFSPELKLDTRQNWRAFPPFDVTVGRKIDRSTVMSLQADVAVINELQQYDWQTEFRIGFFF